MKPGHTVEGSQVTTRESFEYGELWSDGTFEKLSSYEMSARSSFSDRALLDYSKVPQALRPVLACRKVITTTETFPAEVVRP